MNKKPITAINVAIFGSRGVGKYHIISRFMNNRFDVNDFNSAPFMRKTITVDKQPIQLNIRASVGDMHEPKFRTFDQKVGVFLIAFDLTRRDTFEYAKQCLKYLEEFENRKVFLVGTKSDLTNERQIFQEEIDAFVLENTDVVIASSNISVKTGNEDVNHLFKQVTRFILKDRYIDMYLSELKQLTAECKLHVDKNKPAYGVLTELSSCLENEDLTPKNKIEQFFQCLSDNDSAKLKLLKKDNSKNMKNFIKGVGIIAAIILTGIIPGLIISAAIYAVTRNSVFDFFKSDQKGKQFSESVEEVKKQIQG